MYFLGKHFFLSAMNTYDTAQMVYSNNYCVTTGVLLLLFFFGKCSLLYIRKYIKIILVR